MKRALGAAIPMTALHVVCCGGALLLLASSGWLVVLSTEAQNKLALIPLLAITGASFWLWHRQRTRCASGAHGIGHVVLREFSLMLGIMLVAVIMAVYIFISTVDRRLPGGGLAAVVYEVR